MRDTATLLHYLPLCRRSGAVTDWERRFCIRISADSKKRALNLSQKQTEILDRIVGKVLADAMRDDDDLIEREA